MVNNLRIGKNQSIFDIYHHIYPLHLRTNSLEALDIELQAILQNEESYRKGRFDIDLASNDELLQSVELMLKIYNLRLHKRIYESIENTSYIPSDDFRVLAYQYAHNKASRVTSLGSNKDVSVHKWIGNFLDKEKWNNRVNHFITNGGG